LKNVVVNKWPIGTTVYSRDIKEDLLASIFSHPIESHSVCASTSDLYIT